jgi:thymidylate synthase
MFTRGIIEELLWMIRGSTDATELTDKGIHIWDGHTSREHLDATGLHHLKTGDTGPLYGFQFRHSGAAYTGCGSNYDGRGVDQIANVIDSLKTDPGSRRHVVCAWNPSQSKQMALTPCHCLFQFYIDVNGLSCQLYQRSADVALGVPFNITSYALLTHIIAKVVGVEAHEFIHVIGDAHIYKQHLAPISEQIDRVPFPFPTVTITKELKTIHDIEALKSTDFLIKGYKSYGRIKMDIVI